MPIAARNVNFYAPASAPIPVAPVVEGAAFTAYTFDGADNGVGGTNTAFTGRRGARINLPTAQDITTHRYFTFYLFARVFGWTSRLDTVANGGIRVVLVDGSGNYAGYNIYGSDVPGRSDNGPTTEGMLGVFLATTERNCPQWFIDHERTPNISSGTLNKTNIVAVEFSINNAVSFGSSLWFAHPSKTNQPLVTGTTSNTFSTFADSFDVTVSNQRFSRHFQRVAWYFQSTAATTFFCSMGLQVGDGSTTTTLNESAFQLGLVNTYDKSPAFRSVGPVVQLNGSNHRQLLINQSSSDVLTLTDGSIASAAWWQWVLQGSGTATVTRVQFWRYNGFQAAHGTYTDCQWNAGDAPIQCGTSASIVRGVIRDATAGGLSITSGPGVYANIDADFSNNTSFDVEMGSGGAGTYELVNVGVIGSYTLKIRNNSATNAITVAIPAGITYSTSTAGGSITVSTPAVYQSVTINGLVSGSRVQIYDTTSSTELANAVAGTSYTWTDTLPASAARNIRLRVAYVSGATAKQFIDANIGTAGTSESTAAVTYLANQVDDTVYNANAIDGSSVTGISISDSIDRVIINISGGAVSWPQIYAYQVYWLSTSAGIIDDGAFISAPDTANYLLTGFKIRNTSTVPLTISGGYGRDSVAGTVAACIDVAGSTGNIYPAPDHVVPFSTGSGLTAGQAAKLESLDTSAVNVVSIKGQTIYGSGSESDPWRP